VIGARKKIAPTRSRGSGFPWPVRVASAALLFTIRLAVGARWWGDRGLTEAFDEFQKTVDAERNQVVLARDRRDTFKKAFGAETDVTEVFGSGPLRRSTQIRPVHDVDLVIVYRQEDHPDWVGRETRRDWPSTMCGPRSARRPVASTPATMPGPAPTRSGNGCAAPRGTQYVARVTAAEAAHRSGDVDGAQADLTALPRSCVAPATTCC
jgi:hypothetical protein